MATADNVFCSNCGDKIEGEPPDAYDLAQRKPCPRCGSVARSISLETSGGSVTGSSAKIAGRVNLQESGFSVAGSSAKMALITRWWEKDWPLVIDFVIATLGGAITSYWTNGWLSVALSIFVAVVTIPLGLYMAWEVVTIVYEGPLPHPPRPPGSTCARFLSSIMAIARDADIHR
jgi:hypothetical protein